MANQPDKFVRLVGPDGELSEGATDQESALEDIWREYSGEISAIVILRNDFQRDELFRLLRKYRKDIYKIEARENKLATLMDSVRQYGQEKNLKKLVKNVSEAIEHVQGHIDHQMKVESKNYFRPKKKQGEQLVGKKDIEEVFKAATKKSLQDTYGYEDIDEKTLQEAMDENWKLFAGVRLFGLYVSQEIKESRVRMLRGLVEKGWVSLEEIFPPSSKEREKITRFLENVLESYHQKQRGFWRIIRDTFYPNKTDHSQAAQEVQGKLFPEIPERKEKPKKKEGFVPIISLPDDFDIDDLSRETGSDVTTLKRIQELLQQDAALSEVSRKLEMDIETALEDPILNTYVFLLKHPSLDRLERTYGDMEVPLSRFRDKLFNVFVSTNDNTLVRELRSLADNLSTIFNYDDIEDADFEPLEEAIQQRVDEIEEHIEERQENVLDGLKRQIRLTSSTGNGTISMQQLMGLANNEGFTIDSIEAEEQYPENSDSLESSFRLEE